ncbi:MAG: ArgR family transcriptional regulator [bacterium]|nr:ArgR family transcriptional regulator [Coriobacteriales bacterium]MCR5846046.1 ArgR family transcriptional regulator [bacterium]
MKKREERQAVIKQIIRTQNMRTQHDIVNALCNLGMPCTQATISRDVTELDVRKSPEGYYVLAEDLSLKKIIGDMVYKIDRAENLVVIKSAAGAANGVAAALELATLPEVMGMVAGDDTILVIGRTAEEAENYVEAFKRLRP